MGTVYTIIETGQKIGVKRNAGLYCYDCSISMCQDITKLHTAEAEWYDRCPKCGGRFTKTKDEPLSDEILGKSKKIKKKRGINTCCSFEWYIDEGQLDDLSLRKKTIVSTPGDTLLTAGQFKKILKLSCPIQYYARTGTYEDS